MSATSPHGVALITGASTGIGAVYADRLAKRGYDLILVARNTERLDAAAERLHAEAGVQVTPMTADLNNHADLARVEAVLRDDPAITMLVNNAGVGSVASILQADVDEMEAMIDLNITALTRLTYAAAPAFVARGHGAIINISSAVAIAVENLNGVYSASKSYVLSFWQRRACAFRPCCQPLPPRSSGMSPAMRRRRPPTRPCGRKTWLTRPWPASTRARR
jgi:short-subunit dehydrogenase